MKKIIRTSTIPLSLNVFCRGTLSELSKEYEVLAVSSHGKDLSELESREGVRTAEVEMERSISPLKDLVSLYQLIRLFRKERPLMVHSMTPKAGLLSMMAARVTGVKVRVHTFTGLLFPTATGLKRRVLWLTDRITCACSTNIIPEGEGVMNDLQSHHVTTKPLKVLGYGNVRGIDLNYYDRTAEVVDEAHGIRRRLNIPDGAFVFLFVGRMVKDKGICELLSAFERITEQNKNVYMLLVGYDGDGDMARSELEANGCVRLIDWQDDVRPYYAAADALVFPSYREGFPNVVIEAGAMQLPSIVTDINGSREIVVEDVNGTIVPTRDSEALYMAMRRMLIDDDWRRTLTGNAREMIASRYEQGFVRKCLEDYYHELLA
jgi:glycosyltransferase involved in cell wall biosynthesis